MRLLARIGLERDVLDDAELLLESVLKLAPDYRAARFDYARRAVPAAEVSPNHAQKTESCCSSIRATASTSSSYAAAASDWATTSPSSTLYRRSAGRDAAGEHPRPRTCTCGSRTP